MTHLLATVAVARAHLEDAQARLAGADHVEWAGPGSAAYLDQVADRQWRVAGLLDSLDELARALAGMAS